MSIMPTNGVRGCVREGARGGVSVWGIVTGFISGSCVGWRVRESTAERERESSDTEHGRGMRGCVMRGVLWIKLLNGCVVRRCVIRGREET